MKVLMQARLDWDSKPGGDTTQMRQTASALMALGVEVVIDPARTNLDGFDVVHLFNTVRINETYRQFCHAHRQTVPVFVSTIWHSMREMRRYYAHLYGLPYFPIFCYGGLRELYYAARSRCPLNIRSVLNYRGCQRQVVTGAAAILPNSQAELDALRAELGVEPKAFRVVPNGFDYELARAMQQKGFDRSGIVCVGRIEPRKNQARVSEAFKSLGARQERLSFYGAINKSHRRYASRFCNSLVPEWITYAGWVKQAEINEAFARCRVCVLASFFETTGLAALEALACGARIVVYDSPYTREYFRDFAIYCDPYSTVSIASAMARALEEPLQEVPSWLQDYTWEKAALLTRAAYESFSKRTK